MRPNTLANLSALISKLSGLACQVFMWTDDVLLTFNKTNKNDNNLPTFRQQLHLI